MITKMHNEYSPTELGRIFLLHSNTIRLYEKSGFISQAQRNPKNNYRVFTELHRYQVQICRCIFGYPFTTKAIRAAGNALLFASAKKDWQEVRRKLEQYVKSIEAEISLAQQTVALFQNRIEQHTLIPDFEMTRKNVAEYFGVTVDTIRNWERNALILPEGKNPAGKVVYSVEDFTRIQVIYLLLQAGYSIAAIHTSLTGYDRRGSCLLIDEPISHEIISVGDNWLAELQKLLLAAQKIPSLLAELEKL